MKKFFLFFFIFYFALSGTITFAASSEMKLYVERNAGPSDTNGYHGAKFEPKVGSYLGMFAEGDSAVHNTNTGNPFYFDGVPNLTGKKHALYMIYLHYATMQFDHYQTHYQRAQEQNVGMQIALEPNGGLDQVQDDIYLRTFAKQAKESGIPIFLRFANEMNDPGSTWGKDSKKYIEKFRLVATVMHQEAPNVAMCWSPNDWPFGPAAQWYPGDEYVDWVGVSAYPPYLANGKSKHNTKFTDRIKPIYDAYAARKPIYLSEGAPIQNVEFKTTDVSGVAAKDLKEFYDEIARRYPAVKAVIYWDNEETWGAIRKCKLSTNQNVLNAYKNAISNPYFLSEMNSNSPIMYKDLADASCSLKAQQEKISAYVGNKRLDTAKVVYYINGKYVGEATGSPYETVVDFSAYSGQTITLKADAYDMSNKISGSITQKIQIEK